MRNELVNSQYFLELRRGELRKMLDWYYGTLYDYTKAPGKLGKRWQAEFGAELWDLVEQSYAGSQPEAIWQALEAMNELFRRVAQEVAGKHGYMYPLEDDERVCELMRGMK